MRASAGRQQRAQSIVEFAVMAPTLFLLLFGLVDFGRAGFYYVSASGLARTGARDAVVASTGTGYTDTQVVALVKQQADSMAIANLAQPAVCGTSTPSSNLTSCEKPPLGSTYIFIDRSSSSYVEVSIIYAYQPTSPLVSAITGTIYMVASATMSKEY